MNTLTIEIGDRYFNLIEMEYFIIEQSQSSFYPYTLCWENDIDLRYNSTKEELTKFINDDKLNIRVKDEKHLLLLKLTKERVEI